jgi:hypothetical protein
MENQKSDAVVIEVPRWFHRRRGAREDLRERVEELLAQGKLRIVVRIMDEGRFVSMDIGILLGVIRMAQTAGGVLAVATENEKFHALPHPSVSAGLPRFRSVSEAKRYVEEQ